MAELPEICLAVLTTIAWQAPSTTHLACALHCEERLSLSSVQRSHFYLREIVVVVLGTGREADEARARESHQPTTLQHMVLPPLSSFRRKACRWPFSSGWTNHRSTGEGKRRPMERSAHVMRARRHRTPTHLDSDPDWAGEHGERSVFVDKDGSGRMWEGA